MSGFELGVVADDFTGASDAASFMVQGGLDTVLFSGCLLYTSRCV